MKKEIEMFLLVVIFLAILFIGIGLIMQNIPMIRLGEFFGAVFLCKAVYNGIS